MKPRSALVIAVIAIINAACGGGSSTSSGGSDPSDHHSSTPAGYDGRNFYAAVTGKPDSFSLPDLPGNIESQVVWNSIALVYNTGSGTWAVLMDSPAPQNGAGPLSGSWTTTPAHSYQYRVTGLSANTGLAGDLNPVSGNVPYDVFQPTAPSGWIPMPPNSVINVCSVSTNSVYTPYLGGGSISCAIDVMDMVTSEVSSGTINLNINSAISPPKS